MTVSEVRKRYIDFFAKRGHAVIPSAPLVPENDPTTLFTSSGMQPLVPYLLGLSHPEGNRLVNSQMSFRAEDIEEVGDNRHTTFFEMLGNWSLGDYFKQEQLPWLFEFLTDMKEGLGLDPKKLYVTTFFGDAESDMKADTESAEIWKKIGISDDRMFSYGAKKNWWSRAGIPTNMPPGEIGGPDSEVFYDFGLPHDTTFGKECHPNCDCGRFVEIGNSVFMQFIKKTDGTFSELPKKNVDFGGGLERLTCATTGNPDIFMIDVFNAARAVLENRSGKKYQGEALIQKSFRIILDHIRAASFCIASGIHPSNTEQGYVLRRLIRRSIREADKLGIKETVLAEVAEGFGAAYADAYPMVKEHTRVIREELEKEEMQFRKTLVHGLHELEKMGNNIDAFMLFTTYGFPVELTVEIAQERGLSIDFDTVQKQMEKHQDLSRAGAGQKFKGGLADTSEKTTMLHTSTHLMLAGLRKYLGDHVHQAGSNITQKRTRFDFTHPEKVSPDILKKVEDYVNEAITKECTVVIEQMPKNDAQKAGVEGSFWEKYPDTVNVYMVKASDGTVYSRELCGGPHVKNTSQISHFRIIKEKAVAAGIRRIKAVVE